MVSGSPGHFALAGRPAGKVQYSLTEPLNPLTGDKVSATGLLPGGAVVMGRGVDRKHEHRGNGERHRNLRRCQSSAVSLGMGLM